jgi:hypothetical protein
MIIKKEEGQDMAGKSLAVLFIISLIIFSQTSYADESPRNNIFNEYINSPEGNSDYTVDKNAGPKSITKKDDHKKSDTKKSLQEIPFKDQFCVKDSDCTAGVVNCVSWEPLNKKFLKELFKHSTPCPDSIDPGFQPVTVCAKSMCKTTERSTEASWDDWLNER